MPLPLPSSARPLTPDEEELIETARTTIDAVTDAGPGADGVHTMGAAVRSSDGRTFTGVNLYHFTGGPCAELVALGAARADGTKRITYIVAVGNHGRGPVGPCGRDPQVLFDYRLLPQHPSRPADQRKRQKCRHCQPRASCYSLDQANTDPPWPTHSPQNPTIGRGASQRRHSAP